MPSERGKRGPFCTVCKDQLQSVGSGNAITPFWIRSGKFFLYPLHIFPISLIVFLTVLSAQFNQTVVGLLMQFALSIVFMKYAYASLDSTAQGNLKPLPIDAKIINDELELPFKQIILTFAITAANIQIYRLFGLTVVGITAFISTLAFPANVMVLAIERSIFAAFNPIIIFGFIRRIGAAYLLLALFLMLLLTESDTMMNFMPESVSKTNFILISSFVNMYFMLIMYHLMGYILYQYHEVLGYHVEVNEDDDKSTKKGNASQPVTDPELRHFEILLQEGKTDEANNKITQIIRENPTNHEARMMDLKLQKFLGNMEEYEKHAKKYISYLIAQEQLNDASKVINTVLTAAPKFKPENAAERVILAKSLKQNGQNKAAVGLVHNLHVDFPDSKLIPEAYLLAAKILSDNLGQDKQAKAILGFLLKKYPGCEQQDEIKQYLDILKNLGV